MKTKQIEVGSLVKDKWATYTKVGDWRKTTYNITFDLFMPPMGLVKKIKTVKRNKLSEDKNTKITYSVEVAEIEWIQVKVPEVNGETNKYELDYYNRHKTEMDLKHITSYEIYYKNLLKRKAKKTT